MKRPSRRGWKVGSGLPVLALGALAMAGVGVSEMPARADVCFGGGSRHREPVDAGDGSTVGSLRRPGARRDVGMGLVLVAGLGGAWLGTRRKGDGDRGGDDGDAPLK